MRLNKLLAHNLGLSRRQADDLIATGKIKINDQAAILGQRVNDGDKIEYHNQIIKLDQPKDILIAVNKPLNVTCSRKNQNGDKTIYDILPKEFNQLKTVGRLDKNSTGLILLSNNGDFIFRMTHPKFKKRKVYKIRLDQPLQPLHQQMINDFGVQLEDGVSQLILTKLDDDRKQWQAEMHEGRNRQIRRTFKALGYTVTKLHRIQFGPYQLNQLKPGQYQKLK